MKDPYFGQSDRVFFGGGEERCENFGLGDQEFDLSGFNVMRDFKRLEVVD
jgi:hypothetical protein